MTNFFNFDIFQTAKMTSDKWYKAEFRRDCIGKSGPADIINYPQLQQAKKAAGLASQVKYCVSRLSRDSVGFHLTIADFNNRILPRVGRISQGGGQSEDYLHNAA